MLPAEFASLKFPAEARSSCMNCPKAALDGFRSDYRCCTYLPRIPNFLLGLSLKTETGRKATQDILDLGLATPEGMNGTPRQWWNYLEDLENENFGKSEQVLCPMLNKSNGYCRVHAFRNSVCSTFFCLKDHGDRGDKFWDSVQTLGSQVEMALTHWVMSELGFSPEDYVARIDSLSKKVDRVAANNGGWTESVRKKMWGDWFGRELEFYGAAADLVSKNRDILWDIANQSEIFEASKFDRAMVREVPKHLKDQLDPEDLEESGETVSPQELWKTVRKRYENLWKLPRKLYRLNKKYKILENSQTLAIEKRYSDWPYYVRQKKSEDLESHQFLTVEQYELLAAFQSPKMIDWQLLAESPNPQLTRDFLTSMISQKILTVQS